MLRIACIASIFAVTALATLSGCSGIRVVQRTQTGGTVALQGAEDGAREKADEYMRGQCPAGYEVVEEGEAVVGSVTNARSNPTIIGPVTTARTTDTREWRITYKCRGSSNVGLHTIAVYL